MAITEQSRHELYNRLVHVLGEEQAATLMEHLPPVGWADVATKRDLDGLAIATKRDLDAATAMMRSDLDALAVATKRDLDAAVGALRADLGAFADETRRDLGFLRHELQAHAESTRRQFETQAEVLDHRFQVLDQRFESLRHELRADLHQTLRAHTLALLAAFVALAGVILASTRI